MVARYFELSTTQKKERSKSITTCICRAHRFFPKNFDGDIIAIEIKRDVKG